MNINTSNLQSDAIEQYVEVVANHIKRGKSFEHEGDNLKLVNPSLLKRAFNLIPYINHEHESEIPKTEVLEDLRVVLLCADENGLSEAKKEKLDIIRGFCDRIIAANGDPRILEGMPKDVLTGLLGPMLDAKDRAALSQTSKTMHAKTDVALERAWLDRITLGEDLWRSLEARVTPEEWVQLKPNLDNIPPITKEIVDFLKSDCLYFEGKKVFETHDLVFMPAELSINKQGKLTKHLREGDHETVFEYIWDQIPQEKRDVEIKVPYWAVVTKKVIPGSRNKSFIAQRELIQEGYEVPSVLDAITLATMHLENSGEKKEYLLPRAPFTHTRCSEKIVNYQLIVGGFAPFGLDVYYNHYDIGREYVGVLALRKFC